MRLNDECAVPAFVTQALAGIAIAVFCAVTSPVNLGNPQEMTLLELAKRIIWLAGSKSEIVFAPLPEGDPKVRQPDIGRAPALLGWEPRVDSDEGLDVLDVRPLSPCALPGIPPVPPAKAACGPGRGA